MINFMCQIVGQFDKETSASKINIVADILDPCCVGFW